MLPEPATSVRLLVLSASPSRVLLNVMAAPPVVKTEPEELLRTTGAVNTREFPEVVIFAPR